MRKDLTYYFYILTVWGSDPSNTNHMIPGSESQTEKAGPATSAPPSSPLLSTLPLAEPWGPWHRYPHKMGLGTLPRLYPDSLSQEKTGGL